MSLEIGTRLGPYELLSTLGEGGMGEVYRARDSRLQRTVAIKIVRAHLSTDPDFRRRFEREARIISSLDHPNICTVFDIGRENDRDYLVMEYLDGVTLASRLERGRIPEQELVTVATQVAAALHQAHRHDIVHRDLKPGNIMLTSHGAKLMDFGLAKPVVRALAVANAGNCASTTSAASPSASTEQGTLIGTFQYIAPEVLQGAPADSRSDIFSFGCVLYEMIAGRPAFNAPSRISLLAAILEKHPEPLVTLNPATTPELAAIVDKCLVKNPEQRWQCSADLVHALSWVGESKPAVIAKPHRTLRILALIAACALVVIAALSLLFPPWQNKSIHSLRRYSIVLPSSAPIAPASFMPLGVGRPNLAVSPSGEQVVYVAAVGETKQLFLRTNDASPPRPLPGTEGAHSPFFSPDEKSIAFFADGKLKKLSLDGGPAIPLCDAVLGFGGFWAPDDFIYFSPGERSSISRIAASGGLPTKATPNLSDTPQIVGEYWPEVLPGNKGILFGNSRYGIALFDSKTGKLQFLTSSGSSPHWSSTGHILYADDGVLWALPFDLRSLERRGPPALVVDQVQMEQQGAAQFAVTSDQTLFYVRGGDVSDVRFVWVDRSGVEQEFGLPSKRYGQFRLSPDGATLALSVQDQLRSDIWTYDIQRKTLSRLTDHGQNLTPVWSPDGKKLIHTSLQAGVASLVETTPSGTHPRVIATIPGMMTPAWTADGKGVLVSTWESNISTLYFVDVVSGAKQELDRSSNMRVFPALSPDGRWLAYVAEETGRWEIYIRAMGQNDQRWRITTTGGEEPVWDHSGRHLFYRNGDEWMEITISPGPEFHASPPVRVIQGPYVNIPGYSYDVANDGRFLLLKSEYQDKRTSQIEVIENWPSLLEKKK